MIRDIGIHVVRDRGWVCGRCRARCVEVTVLRILKVLQRNWWFRKCGIHLCTEALHTCLLPAYAIANPIQLQFNPNTYHTVD